MCILGMPFFHLTYIFRVELGSIQPPVTTVMLWISPSLPEPRNGSPAVRRARDAHAAQRAAAGDLGEGRWGAALDAATD